MNKWKNNANTDVSNAVIRRLPRYRRYLGDLRRNGVDKISSRELSELTGYTASQIRQDFNKFGGFGQQGYGYNINSLYGEISSILGLDKEYNVILVGAGNLGHAIANYTSNYKPGFKVIGIFDVNPHLIGEHMNGIEIYDCSDLGNFLKKNQVDIGFICTNKESAQDVADELCRANVRGIWNFAPIDLEVPDNVALENAHLSDSLHVLVFNMNSEYGSDRK